MRHNYLFNRGILDTEADPRYVEASKLLWAENCRVSDEGVVRGIKGNEQVGSVLGTVIGSKTYQDDIYVFSYINGNILRITKFNTLTNTVSGFIEINIPSGESMPTNIDFIDFIDDVANDRFLIYYTDGVNSIKSIDYMNPLISADLNTLAKKPPKNSPVILGYADGGITTNKIKDKIFTFRYRYVYKDGSVSALSTSSTAGFVADPTFSLDIDYIANIFNTIKVVCYLDSGIVSSLDYVEVYAINVNLDIAYRIDRHDVRNISVLSELETIFTNEGIYPILSNTDYLKLFDNIPHAAQSLVVVDKRLVLGDYAEGFDTDIDWDWEVDILSKNTDRVGLNSVYFNASTISFTSSDFIQKGSVLYFFIVMTVNGTSGETAEFVSDEIKFYADENYTNLSDMISSSTFNYRDLFQSYGFDVSSATSTSILITILKSGYYFESSSGDFSSVWILSNGVSLKPGEYYEYGLQYYDDYNRTSGVVSIKTIRSPNNIQSSEIARFANIKIFHSPPTWATKFKILRKQKNYSFANFSPDSANVDTDALSGPIYLKLRDSDISKIPDEANRIECVGLSVNNAYNTDFIFISDARIEVTDSDNAVGAGRWLVIEQPNISGYDFDDVKDGTDKYKASSFIVNIPIEDDTNVFKEVYGDFVINNNYHQLPSSNFYLGNGYNQSQSSSEFSINLLDDGDIFLSQFNVRYYRYAASSIDKYSSLGRPSIESINSKRLDNETSVIYSEEYNYDSGRNGTSSFNSLLGNFKDYAKSYGAVKSLYYRDTDLIVFQENKVIRQPYNKNILESIGGDQQLTSGGGVLGTHTSYVGEFGMSHPESLSFRDYALFWVDALRGVIMRLSQDGLYAISNFGMRDYFRELLISNRDVRMKGFFDFYLNEYGLSVGNEGTWFYAQDRQGWTHKQTWIKDYIVNTGVDAFYIDGVDIYKLNVGSNNAIGEYSGVKSPVNFTFSMNTAFSDIKTITSIWIEGINKAFDFGKITIANAEDYFTDIPHSYFEDKEGFIHSYIPMSENFSTDSNIVGLGKAVSGVDLTASIQLTFGMPLNNIQEGDTLKVANTSFSGTILSLDSINDITVQIISGTLNDFLNGILYIQRSSKVSGDNMRGNYFKCTINYPNNDSQDGVNEFRFFAINTEAHISKM